MTADQIARDLCRVIADVPAVFTFNDVEYEGTRGALVMSKRNLEGGMFEVPELSITTCAKKVNSSGQLLDRFPEDGTPEVTDVLQDVGGVSGRHYRIVRTHGDEFGMGLQMDLESVNK